MLATISIVTHGRVDMTRECIKHLEANTERNDVEYILSDNASQDDTVKVFMASKLPNKKVVRYGINTGFGYPHNNALKLARGEYFVVLNNDIFLKERGWLEKLIEPLSSQVVLSGIAGGASVLKPDGYGTIGSQVEYVEGSCLCGQTELFKTYGLFSPSIWKYYFEDSDCSLRYRQMGYEIALVPIQHHHVRGATASTVQDPQRGEIMRRNQSVFLKRWSGYLQNRMFRNRILIKAESLGIGDVLCMTPALEGIREDHPTAEIELDTSFPEIFLHNPYVNAVFKTGRKHTLAYDRIIDLGMDYRNDELLGKIVERNAATTIDSYQPQIFLQQAELEEVAGVFDELREQGKEIIITCALQMSRNNWQGRNWTQPHTRRLFELLHEADERIGIIEVGKDIELSGTADIDLVDRVNLRGLFSVIGQSDLFIGIDSLPFHVAQAFGIKSFVLFGATEPVARVVNFANTIAIRKEGMACLGCYHKEGAAPINRCRMGGEEACMRTLEPEYVMDYILERIDPILSNTNYLADYVRRRKCG